MIHNIGRPLCDCDIQFLVQEVPAYVHDGDRKFFNVLTKIFSCYISVTSKDVLVRSAHLILVIMSSLKLMQCF